LLCAVCCCSFIPQAIQLVPALPTRLLPMLVQNIPHKLRDRSSQCLFLRAVILLAEGKVR
jgi:RNA polymerase I-specific transcription initiation factor RRN3